MAAILRHCFKNGNGITTNHMNFRCITTKKHREKMNRDKKTGPRIDSTVESLAAKGFLRPQKSYEPDNRTKDKIYSISKNIVGSKDSSAPLNNSEKFLLLEACFKEFQHSVPNSLLHSMKTLNDITNFYLTPIKAIVPYDALKTIELPKNLHIQYDYHRFNPTTDTKFNGVSAFPKSSTIVTGLKYKKKYPGHVEKSSWP